MLDWDKYISVADRFQRKAKAQDREDLNHDIVIALAEAQKAKDCNGGGQLSDLAMLQEHLGHASFNTTMRYRKVAGEEHRQWYDRLWQDKDKV